jgi:hypothetical protein
VPCLGLFTQTDPARYGCLGAQHLNQVVDDRNAITLDVHWLAETLARQQTPRERQAPLSHVQYQQASRALLLDGTGLPLGVKTGGQSQPF